MTLGAPEKQTLLRKAGSDFWWTPNHVHGIDRDEITISYSDTHEPLFNQAVPHQPLNDIQKTIDEVKSLHGDASRWWITDVCSKNLPTALLQNGYSKQDEHYAFAVETAHYKIDAPEDVTVFQVSNMEQMLEMYTARAEIFKNEIPDTKQLELELQQCTAPDARVARFFAKIKGECVGTGSMTFFDDLSFSFIWAGGVREAFRGRGIYKSLLKARAQACRDRGISHMGLYGKIATSAPIVEAHGFERCGFMTYYELK